MINDFFGYGEFLQVSSEDEREYPAMVVNATNSSSETWYINYTLEVMLLQNVPDEQPNRKRAMSDMRQILNDLEETITYSDRWQAFSKLSGGLNCVPAIEKGADKGFGWIATFTIKIKKRHGICDLQALMPEYDFETGIITGSTCDPVTITGNTTLMTTAASGSAYVFSIKDTNGVVVGVWNPATLTWEVPPGSTPLNTSNPFKTGQTTSYRTGDDGDDQDGNGASFFLLSHNNGFGANANRFTDTNGGQNYDGTGGSIADIVVNWETWDQVADTVECWYRIPQGTNVSWNSAIDAQNAGITLGGFTLWQLPTMNQATLMSNHENLGMSLLDYAPMNITITGGPTRLWTKTTYQVSTRAASFIENGTITQNNKVNLTKYIVCRTFTLAELGL